MSHKKLSLKGIPTELLLWKILLKWKEQGGLSTRGGNEENHPFFEEERSMADLK